MSVGAPYPFMHLILTATSHADLEPIVVTGSLFAVGRQEPPFNGYDNELVGKLSRRHARLFEQDGCVYLADLGSLNGTSCNGDAVKNVPIEVQTGDILDFGGLAFQVELQATDESVREGGTAAVQRLVLTPERFQETLEPIVISSFPFLLNKNSELFARHKSVLRDALSYMSRHHAHIFLRDDALYIEDLGSTNGTFVSGRKLDERARRLKEGDTITLGSDRLVYSVHLLRSEDTGTTLVPSGIEAVDNPTRTIFVDSPTSFLDVYFVEQANQERQEAEDNGSAEKRGQGAAGAEPGLLAQMSRSFFGGPIFGPRVRAGLVFALVAVGVAVTFWYWQGRDVRAIEAAMGRDDFSEAVALARAYLVVRPDSPAIAELETRASVRLWVPVWQAEIARDDFTAAMRTADEAIQKAARNPTTRQIFELLGWSARVRALLTAGPDPADISGIIERGSRGAELLDWWQADTYSRARSLDRIATALPAFQDEREQVYSDVRQLRSEALDFQPVLVLDRQLRKSLEAGDLGATDEAIRSFQSTHAQLPGGEELTRDLERLLKVDAAVGAEAWLDAYDQLQTDPFVTAPFADHADALRRDTLPDDATIARVEEIRRMWSRGELEAALAGIDELAEGRWAGLGAALGDRYRGLLEGYRDLQDSNDEPGYTDRLFDYYARLRESEDAYLLAELEGAFRDHADSAVRQADDYLAGAEAAWSDYQDAGGIQPEQRLAREISSAFTAQAGRLQTTADGVRRSQRIYERLGRPPPEAWSQLNGVLVQEIAFQRGQVANLAFHEPAVQRQMLKLLPES